MNDHRLITANQENKNDMKIDQNLFLSQVNMVDIKGKTPIEVKIKEILPLQREYFDYAYDARPK